MQQNCRINEPETRPEMSAREFELLSRFIYRECGLWLSESKKGMLAARLLRRLFCLGISDFGGYYKYIGSAEGRADELPLMLDLVTTHKTDFFREPAHFEFLCAEALPRIAAEFPRRYRNGIGIWSAGCSTGEEVYSIAMALSEFEGPAGLSRYRITGTDVSEAAVSKAANGIYTEAAAAGVPEGFRHRYMLRGRGGKAGLFRIDPALRARVIFRHHNLLDDPAVTGADIIFCRNVLIYFDAATQARLVQKFFTATAPGGFLFIGHSETLDGKTAGYRRFAPTIYRRPA